MSSINQSVATEAAHQGLASEPFTTPDCREEMIRQTAYARAASRGFTGGQEVEDWLAAERLIDALLSREIPFGFYG